MRATAFALEESGWRSARVPRFHASPATGHRDGKNLITIPPGGGEGRKEIGGRVAVSWEDNRGAPSPLNLLKSD